MMAYQEGQRLQGSDGQVYVVHGGVPVLESTAPTGAVVLGTPDPARVRREQREDARLRIEQGRADQDGVPSGFRRTVNGGLEPIPGGPSDPVVIARETQARSGGGTGTPNIDSMAATSQVHGDEYLRRFVPPAQWNVVRAYARGDLGSRAGGLSASMLPIIQHAMNYDPSASGLNFAARVKMQQSLSDLGPNGVGGKLASMERMLLHGREVLRSGAALNNFGPGLVGTIGNAARTGYESATGDPAISRYDVQVGNYAPEAQKAIAGVPGGVDERRDRAGHFPARLSQAARAAALQGDAQQAMDAIGAVRDQYRRIMGRDITDALSPEAQEAYEELQAGGFDRHGRPLHPAPGWTGNGGGGPHAPDPYGPNGAFGGPSAPPAGVAATGQTRQEPNPAANALLNAASRQGLTFEAANRELTNRGFAPMPSDQRKAYDGWVGVFRANPHDRRSMANATRTIQVTDAQRIGASAPAAFAGSLFNNVFAGLPSLAVGRDQLDLASAAHPTASTFGNIAGGAIGAGAMELGAGAALARIGMQGARLAAWTPRVGDVLYGSASGASANPEHPFSGAITGSLAGGLGGAIGRGVTRAAGSTLRGVVSPDVQYLRDAGVPLTVGQVARGGQGWANTLVSQTEDRLAGFPVVGDLINARRREGIRAFNRAAFDEGLAPINASTNGIIGEQGVDAARVLRSQAYSDALDPVTLQVDQPFVNDYRSAVSGASRLPQDTASRAMANLRLASENIDPGNSVTGGGFQQAVRRFRRETSANAGLPNGYDFGQTMGQGEAAFTGLLQRQSPQTLPAFNAANEANGNFETLRKAVVASRNGGRSHQPGIFMPSELSNAASATAGRFGNNAGTTQQPFYALNRAGQRLLPGHISDSGTPGRLALGAGLAAVGGGAGYASGDAETGAETAGGTLVLGALLALGGSRTGQRLLTGALLNRPAVARAIGSQVTNQARLGGMFGAGIFSPATMAMLSSNP